MSYRQLTITGEVHQRLKTVAFENHVTMRDLASEILRECLKDTARINMIVKGLPKVAS